MLKLENLSAGYNKKPIIQDINLQIQENKITTIIGPNGSGKSTLLKTIINQTKIQKGQIQLNKKNLQTLKPKDLAKIISYMPQSYNITNLSVEKMVLHGRFAQMSYPRNYSKEDLQITNQIIKEMNLEEIKKAPLSKLSGGQRQKVYLAMVLCSNTKIILMDEPTTYLDIHHQIEILNTIKNLKAQGKTIITVFHDINQAIQISDEIIIMENGKIKAQETPEKLIQTDIIDKTFNIQKTIIKDQNQKSHIIFNL